MLVTLTLLTLVVLPVHWLDGAMVMVLLTRLTVLLRSKAKARGPITLAANSSAIRALKPTLSRLHAPRIRVGSAPKGSLGGSQARQSARGKLVRT